MLLFTRDNSYLIAEDRFLSDFVDGFVIYNVFNDDFTDISYGVMLPDGQDIVLPEDVASITPAVNDGAVTAFILNTSATQGQFVHETYTQAVFRLVGRSGDLITTGPGVMSYEVTTGLFNVQGTDHFAWMDIGGNTLISIPSMAYSFD